MVTVSLFWRLVRDQTKVQGVKEVAKEIHPVLLAVGEV
jgi:hypothetical protein